MRVNLLVVFLTFFSLSVSAANSCHQQILEATTKKFHGFIDSKIDSLELNNSQREFYKTIGFHSVGTESGIKLILNLKVSELKEITSDNEFKQFNSILKDFFEANKRVGSVSSINSFYPKEEDLPCLDESLFLTEHKQCLNGFFTLENDQLSKLQKQIESIFNASALTLKEVSPSKFSKDKVVSVTSEPQIANLTAFTLDADSDLECSKNGLQLKCSFKEPGKKEVRLSDGTRSGRISLEYNLDEVYELSEDLGNNTYNVLKLSAASPDGEAITDFKVTSAEDICKKEEDKIKCTLGDRPSLLTVIPESKEDSSLSLNLMPDDSFYIHADEDKDPLYSYLRPVILVAGKESIESLESVNYVDLKTCTLISESRKLIKCPKLIEPYDIEATRTLADKSEIATYTLVAKSELNDLSLEVSNFKIESLEQFDTIKVLNAGVAISPASFNELGIKLSFPENVVFDESKSLLLSNRSEEAYSYEVSILKNDKVEATATVNVGKHVADNSFFFSVNKTNRFCRLSLMKVNDVKDYSEVGNELYAAEFFDIEIEKSKGVHCSNVERNEGSTQVMCSIPKTKYSGTVKLTLSSNGEVVRTTTCTIKNREYDFDSESEDDDNDDDDDREFKGKTSKRKSAGAEIGENFADVFSSAVPEYLKGKYGQNNYQYYNPLMYQPYYFGGPYLPSSYMPSAWDTRYIFDPATY
jgi:hypothetical protein